LLSIDNLFIQLQHFSAHDGLEDGDDDEEAPEDQAGMRLLPCAQDPLQWRRAVQQLRGDLVALHLPIDSKEEGA
jgi:hypothetical protein